MPHIVGVINKYVAHTFPDTGGDVKVRGFLTGAGNCREYDCRYERVCGYERVCSYERVCEYDSFFDREVCTTERICDRVYQCDRERICGFVDIDGYDQSAKTVVYAKEHVERYTLGSVESGTNPDFLLVYLTANRTKAGSQNARGTFKTAIPNGRRISGTGSTLLESAYRVGGSTWLTRIVSVYLVGNTVKAEFRHSNRYYDGEYTENTISCVGAADFSFMNDDISSRWGIDFEVYVGKFTT